MSDVHICSQNGQDAVRGYELAPPDPTAMVESLRGVGYSLPTAIADLIDNSIAARAANVWLHFYWAGNSSKISLLDDGSGMDESELSRAMRLGGKNPLDERETHDLGRFGLGLKTASFSQCRCLTVASKKDGVMNVRQWDMDNIGNWHLMTSVGPDTYESVAPLAAQSKGTVVLWERLDRVVAQGQQGEETFLKAIDDVEAHLAMVFHRFLEGNNPSLRVFINGTDERVRVRPWDSFLQDHPATIQRPTQPLQTHAGTITVKGFILPHKDKLDSAEYVSAAGPEGWTAQQGFYVYRNKRMLVAGSWLGLGGRAWAKEEAHKLARIRLDIPNSADDEWKIDIKKSVARPPSEIRASLRAIADDVRQTARRVFAHRGEYGQGVAVPGLLKIWKAVENTGGVKYRINREHPVIMSVLGDGGQLRSRIEQMLRVLERTVPVQRIWLDVVEKGEVQANGFTGEASEELTSLLKIMYQDMRIRIGLGEMQAKEKLMKTEPFNQFPDLISSLPETVDQEE